MSATPWNIRLLGVHNLFTDLRPYVAVAVVYFEQVTGSFALAMAVFSIGQVSAAVLEVPTGILSDLMGRRRTIICGSVASLLSVLLYAIGGSFWVLALGGFFEGAMRSFYSGNNNALLHDTLAERGETAQYPHHLGWVSSMFQIGLGSGALIAVLLAGWSLQLVAWISVAPQVCALVISLFFREPKVHERESTNVFAHMREAFDGFRRNAKLRMLSLGAILRYGVGDAMFIFEPAFTASLWPQWAIPVSRVFNHLFGWAGFRMSGRVVARFGALQTLTLCLSLACGLGIIFYAFPSPLSPAMMTLGSLLYGSIIVAQGSLIQKEFTQKQRATMDSLTSLAGSLLLGAVAVGLGLVADAKGPAMALLAGQIALLPLIPLYRILYTKR